MVFSADFGAPRARGCGGLIKRKLHKAEEVSHLLYSKRIVTDKKTDSKDIRETISQLSLTIKTLITNCDKLTT